MNTIDIYTNKTCPYCKQVKEELTKNNIEFNERLTNEWSANWQSIVSLIGMSNVPTVVVTNKDYVHMDHEENNRPVIKTFENQSVYAPGRDFGNQQQLVQMLKNFKNPESNNSRQTLEKIKTLNYNMHTAFSRLDKLLREIETNTKKE
tara:strand:+ start:142 stop:585 length:444 start_codon:yes stop_codon:yes gene_type:complete